MTKTKVAAGPCQDCGEFEGRYFGTHPTLCRHCEPVNPRWRDYHTLPDERLLRPIQKWFYRRKREDQNGTISYPFRAMPLVKAMARYSLRHFHCNLDGQCVFRAHHRGGCCWGSEE